MGWILGLRCEWIPYPGYGSEPLFLKCKIPRVKGLNNCQDYLHIVQKCKIYNIDNCYRYGGYIAKKHSWQSGFLIWFNDLIYFNCLTILRGSMVAWLKLYKIKISTKPLYLFTYLSTYLFTFC